MDVPIIKLTMLVFNLPPGRFLVYGFTLIVIRSKRHSEPIFVGLRGLTNWNLNDSLKQEALHMNHRMLLDVTQEAERYLFGFRSSVQDGPILLADLPLSEKIGQAFVHLRRLCHN